MRKEQVHQQQDRQKDKWQNPIPKVVRTRNEFSVLHLSNNEHNEEYGERSTQYKGCYTTEELFGGAFLGHEDL